MGWELGKVFYLKAAGPIYPRSAEICSSWVSITAPWEGAGSLHQDLGNLIKILQQSLKHSQDAKK